MRTGNFRYNPYDQVFAYHPQGQLDAVVTDVWVVEPQVSLPLAMLGEQTRLEIQRHINAFPPNIATTTTTVNGDALTDLTTRVTTFNNAYQHFITTHGQLLETAPEPWVDILDHVNTLYGLVLSLLPGASLNNLNQTTVSVAGWLSRLRRMTNSILVADSLIDLTINQSPQAAQTLSQAMYELTISDHLPVVFTLCVNPNNQQLTDAAALFTEGTNFYTPSPSKKRRGTPVDPPYKPKRRRVGSRKKPVQ